MMQEWKMLSNRSSNHEQGHSSDLEDESEVRRRLDLQEEEEEKEMLTWRKSSRRSNTLVHRHNASSSTSSGNINGTSAQHLSYNIYYATANSPLRRSGAKQRYGKSPQHWGQAIRLLVLVLIVTYLLLVYISDHLLLQYRRASPLSSFKQAFLEQNSRLSVIRERLQYKANVLEPQKMKSIARQRAQQRAQRTQPPPMTKKISSSWYKLQSGESQPLSPSTKEDVAAQMLDLCGAHARNASKLRPESFPSQSALRHARVLITGILNPIGIHLALFLSQHCGVQIIAGIDPVFPNTVAHRLDYQRRIQLLTTNIPNLMQPIVQPLVGLDPRPSKSQRAEDERIDATGELNLLQTLEPTHVVHLATYTPDEYRQPKPELRNLQSPYVGSKGQHETNLLYYRSTVISMEQILASLQGRHDPPHLVYAASPETEILADTYHAHEIIGPTVGMRLPKCIYGPWGRGVLHDLMKERVRQLGNETSLSDVECDYVHVQDIVEGIVTTMQYRDPQHKSTVLDFGSDSRFSLRQVGQYVSHILHKKNSADLIPVDRAPSSDIEPSDRALHTRNVLQWAPKIQLSYGLASTVAWHIDDAFPFGNKIESIETGDELRKRLGIDKCDRENLVCHMGRNYLPCASECSAKTECLSSIWDSILELTQETTQGCDIILYTQSIGYNVQDLKLHATYQDEGEVIICNFAFVPEASRLVSAAIDKVPEGKLEAFGINVTKEMIRDKETFRRLKMSRLNGRLLYKGWILIWAKEAEKTVPQRDISLLKIAPGKFFSSDVGHALFVDENFPLSPTPDDVLFLVSQTYRPALPDRNAYRKMEDGKKIKYRLSAEPERRAALLLSPLKYKKTSETGQPAKISVYEATKYMQVENGDSLEARETMELKKQREFYERIPTFINRLDFRSVSEAWYKYELKHWVRTRWIVHDLKLEEGRQLRCDWYHEHIQWGNKLDQLSFAHVMTTREIERRIALQEPDDHVKSVLVEHPELLHLTDAHEWHALESQRDGIHATTKRIADHLVDKDEEEDQQIHNVRIPEKERNNIPLFVRIVSERVMLKARQTWALEHGLVNT